MKPSPSPRPGAASEGRLGILGSAAVAHATVRVTSDSRTRRFERLMTGEPQPRRRAWPCCWRRKEGSDLAHARATAFLDIERIAALLPRTVE